MPETTGLPPGPCEAAMLIRTPSSAADGVRTAREVAAQTCCPCGASQIPRTVGWTLQPVTVSCSTFDPSVTRMVLATDTSSCTKRFVTLLTLLDGFSE